VFKNPGGKIQPPLVVGSLLSTYLKKLEPSSPRAGNIPETGVLSEYSASLFDEELTG
jgi:hypothetical protein